jgi:hypothetical protein
MLSANGVTNWRMYNVLITLDNFLLFRSDGFFSNPKKLIVRILLFENQDKKEIFVQQYNKQALPLTPAKPQ